MYPLLTLLGLCILMRACLSQPNANPNLAPTEEDSIEGLLTEISNALSQPYDQANSQEFDASYLQMRTNWNLPQWPWGGDGDNHTTQPPLTQRNRFTHSLDGYLELLRESDEPVPDASHGVPISLIHPRRLRFVENSGVCGERSVSPSSVCLLSFPDFQRKHGCVPSIGLRRPDVYQAHVVCHPSLNLATLDQ